VSVLVRSFGHPRLHHSVTDSTNSRARELAARGVPDGTVVTAGAQSAGRGRQGRSWSAPPGRSLLCSLVIREPPRLLPLAAGVAVAEITAELSELPVRVKWPNDVLLGGGKVAGILVEGRPQERWAVLGIGLNLALAPEDFPAELRDTAATLGLEPDRLESVLTRLLRALERWVAASEPEVLRAVRERDALLGRPVRWSGGHGTGAGIDDAGRLLVDTAAGGREALDAGEVHLTDPRATAS
jgi:BirA family biotin operon repressor/biotin-[acetyl-CoA-carboxylase] ligase